MNSKERYAKAALAVEIFELVEKGLADSIRDLREEYGDTKVTYENIDLDIIVGTIAGVLKEEFLMNRYGIRTDTKNKKYTYVDTKRRGIVFNPLDVA